MAMRDERLASEKIFSAQFVLADGRTIAVINHAIANGGWVSTHEDITDRKNSDFRIEQLAHFDGLTGLANRNLFKERLDAALARHRRLAPNSPCFCSISSGSKTSTSPSGIRPETSFSRRWPSGSRPRRGADIPARLGGDEFAVIAMAGEGNLPDRADSLAAPADQSDQRAG